MTRCGWLVVLGLAACAGSSPNRVGSDGGDPPNDPDSGVLLSIDAGPDAGGVIAQGYSLTYLVSNGMPATPSTDMTLVNPWEITADTTGPAWVALDGSGTVLSYSMASGPGDSFQMPSSSGTIESPVGLVWNGEQSFDADQLIAATDSGQIVGWSQGGTTTVRVDNSSTRAVYKSLALARSSMGDKLYAANFRTALVEIYNGDYSLAGTFTDPGIPSGFAPFNIVVIDQMLYVTYAKQDDTQHDQVNGAGNGYVDVFDLTGALQTELLSGGSLNSPYGLVYSPIDFGRFANLLLIANVGDGKINVFDPVYGTDLGPIEDTGYEPIEVPGIHALLMGNDDAAGSHDTLLFSAAPAGSATGAFGMIQPAY